MVEGKANSEMATPVVMAKRDAARDWVAAVNDSDIVQDTWGYRLASKSVIATAQGWTGMTNGGRLSNEGQKRAAAYRGDMSVGPHDDAQSDFSQEVLAELRRRRDLMDTADFHSLEAVLGDLGIAPNRLPRHPPDDDA